MDFAISEAGIGPKTIKIGREKVWLTSDLHLGKEPNVSLERLKVLKDQHGCDLLFFNGDCAEGNALTPQQFLDIWGGNIDQVFDHLNYGNHDLPDFYNDETKALFGGVGHSLIINGPHQQYIVVHGDKIGEGTPLDKYLPDLSIINKFNSCLEKGLVKLLGRQGTFYAELANKKVREEAALRLEPDQVLVVGHTHKAGMKALGENRGWINTGALKYPQTSTVLEISPAGVFLKWINPRTGQFDDYLEMRLTATES